MNKLLLTLSLVLALALAFNCKKEKDSGDEELAILALLFTINDQSS